MKNIKITAELFGDMEFSAEEGLSEFYTVVLNGKKTEIFVYIFENFITESNSYIVRKFLDKIPIMYAKAKEKLFSDYKTNELIKFFIKSQINEIDENCLTEYFEIGSVEELTSEVFITKLELRSISIAPIEESKSNDIDCTLDFSLDKELSDELLVFRFNKNLEIYEIAHES